MLLVWNKKLKMLFRIAFILFVLAIEKTAPQLTNRELTQLVRKLEEKLISEKTEFEHSISVLKNQVKSKLIQVENDVKLELNETKVYFT